MVLVRSESGQLLMIPQQALAQMQAQAQGGLTPRAATPTSAPPAQVGTPCLPWWSFVPSTIVLLMPRSVSPCTANHPA